MNQQISQNPPESSQVQQEKQEKQEGQNGSQEEPQKRIKGVNYDYSFQTNEARRQVCYIEKQNGAVCINAGELEEALTHYSKALMALHHQFKSPDSKLTQQEGARLIGEIEIPCNSNMALCYFKLEGWESVIKHCNKVLELDPKKIKALYRRGIAHTRLGNFTQAANDIRNGLRLEPKNEQLLEAREELQIMKQLAKQKQAHFYKTMFKKKQGEQQPTHKRRKSARVRMPKETLADVVYSLISYALGKTKDVVCCPCRTAKKTGVLALKALKPSTYRYLLTRLKEVIQKGRQKLKRD